MSPIIAPVAQPNPWISSLVISSKKDGRLWLCLDPQDLNKAIQREHYPLPAIKQIATRLHGAKLFTTLDVHHGFWHIALDEESSLLTTFLLEDYNGKECPLVSAQPLKYSSGNSRWLASRPPQSSSDQRDITTHRGCWSTSSRIGTVSEQVLASPCRSHQVVERAYSPRQSVDLGSSPAKWLSTNSWKQFPGSPY